MSLTPVEQNIICHTEQITALTTQTNKLKTKINALKQTIADSDLENALTKTKTDALYAAIGDLDTEVSARNAGDDVLAEALLPAPVARTNPTIVRSGVLAPSITKSNIGYIGTLPIYADDTAADDDDALGSGGLYRLTGDRTVFIKP